MQEFLFELNEVRNSTVVVASERLVGAQEQAMNQFDWEEARVKKLKL